MHSGEVRDVDSLVDGIGVNRFMVSVWVLCFLVMFLDGYDITVIAFVAPHLVRDMGFDKTSLGLLFSASLVGMMVGATAGGVLADRRGRRFTIIAGCVVFGLATAAMLLTTSLSTMALCRLVVGIGMGASLATVVALAAEFAPQRIRGRVIALVGMATPVGSVMPGLLTATLVPSVGWRMLLVVGGVLPVLLAIVLLRKLPESIKYLTLRPQRHDELARTLGRMSPDLSWDPALAQRRADAPRVSSRRLFSEGMAPITLLMWALLFTGSMALYLVNNWMPLVLENVGLSIQDAGAVSALFAAGGVVGIIGVALLFPRAGIALPPTMFLIAVPFLLWTVTFDAPRLALFLCLLVAGAAMGAVMVLGNVLPGVIYPTEVRATGVGLVVAAGRIGAIAGPLVGSAVFALNLPPQRIFAVAAVPMAIGALATIVLMVICYRRFGGFQLREDSAPVRAMSTERLEATSRPSRQPT